MSAHSAATRSRRRRRLLFLLATPLVVAGGGLLWLRTADRHAWPARLPDVTLAPAPATELPPAENAWTILRQLARADAPHGSLDAATKAEFLRFGAEGFGEGLQYPGIATWAVAQAEALPRWSEAARLPDAWSDFPDLAALYPALIRVVELARLANYRALAAVASNDWDAATAIWTETFAIARHVTRGPGTLGLFVALNTAVGASRDVLLVCAERDVPPAAAAALQTALRTLDAALPPLAEALRRDWVMGRRALDMLLTPRSRAASPEVAHRHLATPILVLARWLGSSPTVSARHFDALCSHAIAAAERPYDPAGLFAGLPPWTRLERRAPWSRDPLGAMVGTLFIRNVSAAPAYLPHLRTELRAARIALALNSARQTGADRAWPPTLDALAAHGLDPEALRDPFAADDAPFAYRLEDDGWRLYGVGLDQRDGGGTNDWLSAGDGLANADMVFTSKERARRRAVAATHRSRSAATP